MPNRSLLSARRFALAAAGLVLAATSVTWLSRPALTAAFSLTGDSLALDQRDFRVFNNFLDPQANDNTFPHPNFPGYTGATMAIWKAHAEWGSEPRGGNGLGDGLAGNANIGNGAANFDNTFQGEAENDGGVNGNVHSAASLGGGILSMVQFPCTDGWQVLYNEDFTWDDGPGSPAIGTMDLQAIATHEIGHTLGLAHSSVAGATMFSSITGNAGNQRSIEADDIAGLQSIYGVKSASKPHISALSTATDVGSALTITGSNFAATGNEVWFTAAAADGTPAKLTGVASTMGGTKINVVIPATAAAGEVLVHTPGTGGATLSNAFPIDIGSPPGSYILSGPGLAGTGGAIPQLTGSGDLTSGTGVHQLLVQLAKASAQGSLFVGLTEGNVPFKGGILDPVPILVQITIFADATGKVVLPAVMPPGLPSGLTIVTQAWFADAAAVQGISGSNSLTEVLP